MIDAKYTDAREKILELTACNGVSVVIDAACTKRSFEQALDLVYSAGRIITLGFNSEPSAIVQLSITAREIDVRGSR